MGSHTKGPWRVYPFGTSVPGYDVCARIVADTMTGLCAHEGPSDANAALIAAAPDLFEACRELANLADEDPAYASVFMGQKLYDQLRAAIKKATGEE